MNNLEGELKSTVDIVMNKHKAENLEEAELKEKAMEVTPSVAEARVAELVAETGGITHKEKEERRQAELAQIETLSAEIKSGKVEGAESQDQLASDYLAAYGEYKKLSGEYMQNLRVLDGMRDEKYLIGNIDKAESDISSKEKELALLSQKTDEALRKYSKIGEKLTTETKEKYLK